MPYVTLRYVTLHYITSHHITSHHITSHHITSHHITLHTYHTHIYIYIYIYNDILIGTGSRTFQDTFWGKTGASEPGRPTMSFGVDGGMARGLILPQGWSVSLGQNEVSTMGFCWWILMDFGFDGFWGTLFSGKLSGSTLKCCAMIASQKWKKPNGRCKASQHGQECGKTRGYESEP